MYSETQYEENRKQLKQRILTAAIPAALLLAGTVASFMYRRQVLTAVMSIVFFSFIVFMWGMFISPVAAYGKHLAHARSGRTRQTVGVFKSMESAPVGREGVQYYPVILSVGSLDNEEDDRLFYLDANLPLPAWKSGDRLEMTSYDKIVTDWKSLSK